METSGRMARSVALVSFLGSALVGGAAMDLGAPTQAEAGFDVDESYFYVSLGSEGNWVRNDQFGWVWYPYGRSANWRPYTMGRWVSTSYGDWMWVSDESFGWATYHYGRWFMDPYYGWAWMPGRVWAPAWVSWRECDDYVGWAPLGPWGYWDNRSGGYRDWNRWDHNDHGNWHDRDHDSDHHGHGWNERPYRTDRDDEHQWNFTRKRDFSGDRVDRALLDPHQTQDAFRRSRDLPPPSQEDERQGRGVSRGLDRRTIEHALGRPIKPVLVEDDDSGPDDRRSGGHGEKYDEKSDRVKVWRPKVEEAKPGETPDHLGVAKPSEKDRDPKGGWGRKAGEDSGNDRSGDRGSGRETDHAGKNPRDIGGYGDNPSRDRQDEPGAKDDSAKGSKGGGSQPLLPAPDDGAGKDDGDFSNGRVPPYDRVDSRGDDQQQREQPQQQRERNEQREQAQQQRDWELQQRQLEQQRQREEQGQQMRQQEQRERQRDEQRQQREQNQQQREQQRNMDSRSSGHSGGDGGYGNAGGHGGRSGPSSKDASRPEGDYGNPGSNPGAGSDGGGR